MSDVIPTELQIEILKRVNDVNSLTRFKSVSKEWKSFIKSSQFITSYASRYAQPPRTLVRYTHYSMCNHTDTYISFVDDNDTFTQQTQQFVPNVPVLVQQLTSSIVVGTSHGLLCLFGKRSGTDMVVICNFSIRKCVGIHVPYNFNDKETAYGFGVCPVTYDPTVVTISYSDKSQLMIPWRVEVFTLSSGVWESLVTDLPRNSIRILELHGVEIDGFIYWAAEDVDFLGSYMIVSFDLSKREFGVVELPDALNDELVGFITTSKLNKSLIVSGSHTVGEYPNDTEGFGVWKLELESNVVISWTELFTILNTPDTSISTVLGFRKNGEAIIVTNKLGESCFRLEAYDTCSQRSIDLGIRGEYKSLFVDHYMESLLLSNYSDCSMVFWIH